MRVVFPLPKKPVMIVTGVGVMVVYGDWQRYRSTSKLAEGLRYNWRQGQNDAMSCQGRAGMPLSRLGR